MSCKLLLGLPPRCWLLSMKYEGQFVPWSEKMISIQNHLQRWVIVEIDTLFSLCLFWYVKWTMANAFRGVSVKGKHGMNGESYVIWGKHVEMIIRSLRHSSLARVRCSSSRCSCAQKNRCEFDDVLLLLVVPKRYSETCDTSPRRMFVRKDDQLSPNQPGNMNFCRWTDHLRFTTDLIGSAHCQSTFLLDCFPMELCFFRVLPSA